MDVGQTFANLGIYLGIPTVILIFVGMYMAERVCRRKNKVIYVREDGDTDVEYVDKEGGQVRVTNPVTKVDRLWPITHLSTIGQPYPDLGILPRFLTREIRTVIVVEGDIEPLLNRSPHRDNVVSPNVMEILKKLKERDDCTKDIQSTLQEILDNVVTGPTRDLVARPEWAGALERSSVLKALASVGDTLLDELTRMRNQLARFTGLNATYIYIGLALSIILNGILLYFVIQPAGGTEVEMLQKIMDSLGIAR